MTRGYLDYQSGSPVDPRVVEAMLPYMTEQFGNPSVLFRSDGDAELELAVRPARPMQNAVLSLHGADGRLITQHRRRAVWPAEVETLRVERTALQPGETLSVAITGE